MSTDPQSVNYRPLTEGESEGRALRRKKAINEAVAASVGDAGQAQGDRAKKSIAKKQQK